jgi:hypothetical protein
MRWLKNLVVPESLKKAMAARAQELGAKIDLGARRTANAITLGGADYVAAGMDTLGQLGKPGDLRTRFENNLANEQALTRTGEPYDGSVGLIVAAPPGVSLEDNIREAERRRDPVWFFNQVKPYGPWDYKRKYGSKYEEFGNLNYGATGRATGFPPDVLRRGAGAMQVGSDLKGQAERIISGQDPKPMDWARYLTMDQYPYGDNNEITGKETPDRPKIDRGIRLYDRRQE